MNKERWEAIEKIYFAAAPLEPNKQEEYLRSTCRGDDALYAELKELLRESRDPSPNLRTPVFDLGMKVLEARASVGRRVGTTLGRYRLGRPLGTGGMGHVYEAEDLDGHRKVAVKVINEEFAVDPQRLRRFRQEEAAVSMISHPNVAKVYGLLEESGETFIVMEFVDGKNLRRVIEDGISPDTAVDICIQITSAVVSAHRSGVVHRDIKPENIIVTPDGSVKVLDFGLAKLVDPVSDMPAQTNQRSADGTAGMSTEHGLLIGTPAYMSPEQIRCAGVDTQTDIWSLGVVFYEMLSGRPPFSGKTKIDTIAAILLSEPPQPDLRGTANSQKIRAILEKALAKNKADRFSNAAELLADLREVKNTEQTVTSGGADGTLFPWRYAGTVLAALLLIALMLGWRKHIASYFFASHDGLVSYWPAEGNADDVAGRNDGRLVGNATFASGTAGTAFYLDGINGYIEIPDSPSTSITGPFTLEANIKLDAHSWQQSIIEKYDEPGSNGYALRIENGKLAATVCDASMMPGQVLGGTTVTVGIWHSVAAVYDGASIRVYLDGNLDGRAATSTKPTDGEGSLKIGARGDDAKSRVSGLIDEVKIYNRARSFAEIHNTGGLVSYWPADGNAYDVVGRNHGVLLNGATYRSGVSGEAFSFDGIDDLFQAPARGLPTGNNDRTISMWVTVDDFVELVAFFGGYGNSVDDQSYSLGTFEKYPFITNYGDSVLGILPLTPGRWYHLAATSTATTNGQSSVSLYVDGTLVKTAPLRIDTPVDTLLLSGTIPGKAGKIRKLKGATDEIEVFNRALSAEEIYALYLDHKPVGD